MKAKRILHVIPGYGGGISNLVRNIVMNSDNDKIINDVVGFSDYPEFFLNELRTKYGNAYTLPSVHKGTIAKSIKAYINILKCGKYDVVHIHLRENQFIYFAILTKIFGIGKVVAHAHIADDERMKNLQYRMNLHIWRYMEKFLADQLASCSKKASEFVYGKKVVRNHGVMHIPNGVDLYKYIYVEQFSSNDIRREKNLPENKLIVGNIGYLGYQKNHPYMIKIAKRMKERNIDFVMLFIGHGTEREKLENLCKDMGVEDVIIFLGRREDVAELFKCMNVVILPSFFEGLPTVAIEAQAAGIPQVISDTITTEVDLGLGILNYLSLEDGVDIWIDEILRCSQLQVPCWNERKAKIEEKYFSAESSANLYKLFIMGKVDTYNIGEIIQNEF